jgi:CRISPR-associated protein Csm3
MQGGLAVTEAKMEIAVDRITAQALPRTIERIPAGARFDFAIIYKVQTNDKCEFDSNADNAVLQQDLKNILWALEEIETHDGIGGNTSRGHGQVKFHLRTLTVKNFVVLASDGCPQKPGNLDTEKDYSFDAFQTAVSEIAFSLSESNSIT